MNTCASRPKGKEARDISPHDYIGRGSRRRKSAAAVVGTRVGAGATFNECGHGEVWGSPRKCGNIKSVVLWKRVFYARSKKIAKRVFSIWLRLCCRLTFEGGNRSPEGEESVRSKATPRNFEARLKERGVTISVSRGW